MRKIIKWLKADPKRMAGILLALLAVLVAVFFVRSLLAPKVQEQKANKQDQNIAETERNLLIEDLNLNGNDAEDVVLKAFGAETKNGMAILPGVVSRKLQMVPLLINAIRQERD